jgi:hypothetical protein
MSGSPQGKPGWKGWWYGSMMVLFTLLGSAVSTSGPPSGGGSYYHSPPPPPPDYAARGPGHQGGPPGPPSQQGPPQVCNPIHNHKVTGVVYITTHTYAYCDFCSRAPSGEDPIGLYLSCMLLSIHVQGYPHYPQGPRQGGPGPQQPPPPPPPPSGGAPQGYYPQVRGHAALVVATVSTCPFMRHRE